MTQILDALPTDCANRIICCYVNSTHKIKIARIANISSWYFERVIFPGERLLFETVIEAELEIYQVRFSVLTLVGITACAHLAVNDLLFQPERIA